MLACLAGLLVSVILWVLAPRSQNYHHAANGRSGPIIAGVGALVAGAAPALINFFQHSFRFHDLRHTCVSLLIAAGANPKEIQQRMGHSSIQITMDLYGYLFPDASDRLADVLDATHDAALVPSDNVQTLRAPGS